jgi:hypothetical protein
MNGRANAGQTEGEKLKRKGILVLTLAATLLVGVSTAYAAKRVSTDIVFINNEGPSLQDQTLFGDLDSKPKCIGARTVGLFKQTSSGFKLLDVDLSSLNGAWAVRADLTGTPDLAIKVQKEKRNHKRVVCKGATLKLSADSPQYPRVH